jgi:hypothetical protein
MPLNTVPAKGGSQLSDSNRRFLRGSDTTRKYLIEGKLQLCSSLLAILFYEFPFPTFESDEFLFGRLKKAVARCDRQLCMSRHHAPPRRLSAFKLGARRRRLARWNDGPSHPPLGPFHSETKRPANVPGSLGVFPPRRNAYFAPAEMSIAAVLNREN